MTHWLEAPDPLPVDRSGLPDPLARVGRHVCFIVVLGAILSHHDWWTTHAESCPPQCWPLPKAAPACSTGYSASAIAFQQFVGKYKRCKPVDEWVKSMPLVPLNFNRDDPYA